MELDNGQFNCLFARWILLITITFEKEEYMCRTGTVYNRYDPRISHPNYAMNP